jgi:hypothetical protein
MTREETVHSGLHDNRRRGRMVAGKQGRDHDRLRSQHGRKHSRHIPRLAHLPALSGLIARPAHRRGAIT